MRRDYWCVRAIDAPEQPAWGLFDLENDRDRLGKVYHRPEYLDVVRELKAELRQLRT